MISLKFKLYLDVNIYKYITNKSIICFKHIDQLKMALDNYYSI